MMYRHDEDAPTLRAVLATLTSRAGLKQKALLKEFDVATGLKPEESMSLPTFRRFIKGVGNCEKIDVLGHMWEFFHTHPKYTGYFEPKKLSIEKEPERVLQIAAENESPGQQLSKALARFFCEQKRVNHLRPIEDVKDSLAGQYVMYRYDPRRAKAKLPSNGSILESFVEIYTSAETLHIRETQDFKSKEFGVVKQTNEGVIFAYGMYLIALMNARDGVSFKCLAFRETSEFAGQSTVTSFKGLIFVASEVELFPSVKFYCQRVEEKPKTGIFQPKEIKNELAKAYISTPTFPGYTVIS